MLLGSYAVVDRGVEDLVYALRKIPCDRTNDISCGSNESGDVDIVLLCKGLQVAQHLVERSAVPAQVGNEHPHTGNQLRDHRHQENGEKQNDAGDRQDDT